MGLKINEKKFEVFLEVARKLNDFFNVIPILYGSLGLYKIIGEYSECSDIDILIPDEFVNERWDELIDLMEKMGFKLKDEHEHEFIRGSEIVAFAKQDNLIKRIELDPNKLIVSNINNIKFKELLIKNYLSVYRLMLRDDYRQKKRKKADQEKIDLIEKYIPQNRRSD